MEFLQACRNAQMFISTQPIFRPHHRHPLSNNSSPVLATSAQHSAAAAASAPVRDVRTLDCRMVAKMHYVPSVCSSLAKTCQHEAPHQSEIFMKSRMFFSLLSTTQVFQKNVPFFVLGKWFIFCSPHLSYSLSTEHFLVQSASQSTLDTVSSLCWISSKK